MSHNVKVDVREIGTIVRSLGHCPSESQLQEVIGEMEDTEQMGYIHLDRFLPVISRYLGHMVTLNFLDCRNRIVVMFLQIGNLTVTVCADKIRNRIVCKGSFCNKSSSPRLMRSCWQPSGHWIQRTQGTWTGRSSPSCSLRRGRPLVRRR